MNYIKIQKKILDNFLKKDSALLCTILDDCYLISDNHYQLFRIPISEMWLDVGKMMEGRNECTSLKTFIKIDGEDGVLTYDIKELHDEKITAIKVTSENHCAWLNKKLLDRFEIKKKTTFHNNR